MMATRTTIEQSVVLPAAAEDLYAAYLDPIAHTAITGSRVEIDAHPGAVFRAFNDMLTGLILHTVPGRMIVQTWRSQQWRPEDLDSVITMRFLEEEVGSARIELVHVGVAESDLEGVRDGWTRYYWNPWREYLERG
jgi:activator of HSP90 ATPase